MKYVCSICGFVYDEAQGIPGAGIAPGTKWEALPEGWTCPWCGAAKRDFRPQDGPPARRTAPAEAPAPREEDLRALTCGELSALCSNLARGCEKQYLARESALFTQLSQYYKEKTPREEAADVPALLARLEEDLKTRFPVANAAANAASDRGALRILVWSEKVTRILTSLLERYETEGPGFLEHTGIYVCDICGFVYVGDQPPEICPVCKVPSFKILPLQRRA